MALEDELREYLTGREQYGDRAHQLLRMVLAALTERKAPMEVEGLVERDNHHNAAKCPHCTDNGRFVMVEATELATLKQQLAESTPSPDGEGVRLAKELERLTDLIEPLMPPGIAHPRVQAQVIAREVSRTAQNTGRDEVLEADVVRLVIAARAVAFGECRDFADERYSELDAASEAFADRVPWENGDEA